MGRRKELIYYNGCLKGKYLTDKDCQILDNLRELSDKNGCVSDLKRVIYNLSPDEVEFVKQNKSADYLDKDVGELEDPQTIGVAYMYFAQRMVLGDSVGLGKTVEVCGLCNLIAQKKMKEGYTFRFLYLTEKSLISQARDEMIKFTGEYVELLRGEKKYVQAFAEENSDELLYSVVGTHSLFNSVEFQDYIREYRAYYGCNPFDALIVDEASILGNTSTKTYKNAQYLAQDFDWVILMNATPFESNLRTFYAQLNFCDESLLPVKTVFQRLYEEKDYYGAYPRFNGKYKNAHIFKDQVKYRYFARTRKGLGAKMEGCTADLVITDVSSLQRELLRKTSMPQMVYDCPSYFDNSIVMDRNSTPKIGALLDLLNNKISKDEQVIVYSWYKETIRGLAEVLEKEGVSFECMNGETPLDVRNDIVRKFKLGDIKVLVTNVQKGLNFGHCNYCIFYSYDPNPNKMVQFEGRMTRSKDIINKHVYLIVSKGKELNRFKKVVSDRAKASDLFAGSDFSCILNLLLEKDEFKG